MMQYNDRLKVFFETGLSDYGNSAFSGVHRYVNELNGSLGRDNVRFVYASKLSERPSVNDGLLEDNNHTFIRKVACLRKGDVLSRSGVAESCAFSPKKRKMFGYGLRLAAGMFCETIQTAKEIHHDAKECDLIHVNRIGCEIQAIAARFASNKPVIGTVHNLPGVDERARHPVRRFVEWLSLRSAHHLIAVSKQTRDEWVARTGVSVSKFTIIYNGMAPPIDLPSIEEARKRFDVPADVFCVGICARLHRMKGHGVLFNALSALKETEDRRLKTEEPSSQRKLMLLVAGEGPLEVHLKQQVTDLELEDSIRFLGHVKDPLVFLRALDVQVLPSVELECLPYSIVEGMHCGVASIVSDVGGAKEIVGASGGGSVVPAGDVPALASSIMAYSQDRERCVREGLLAQRFAQDHLTATVMVQKTLEVYQKAVGKDLD